MSKFLVIFMTVLVGNFISAQTFFQQPLANTYSIVAVDSVTGEIGAAVQSHWFSVGSLVLWAEAGVGAIATQSFVNVSYGPRGLKMLKAGDSPEAVLQQLLADDAQANVRQVAIIDPAGNTAAHTGDGCIAAAGHINRKWYSVQANLMLKPTVWPAMEQAFLNSEGPLVERLLAALLAAENEGGDIRGKQSAALLVVKPRSSGKVWEDRMIDLRVEDHAEPLEEIVRLLKVHRAYDHMNAGDHALETGRVDDAVTEYAAAQKLMPESLEMKYWTAVTLANVGKLDQALEMFAAVFSQNENWRKLIPRLVDAKLLTVSKTDLERILQQ